MFGETDSFMGKTVSQLDAEAQARKHIKDKMAKSKVNKPYFKKDDLGKSLPSDKKFWDKAIPKTNGEQGMKLDEAAKKIKESLGKDGGNMHNMS